MMTQPPAAVNRNRNSAVGSALRIPHSEFSVAVSNGVVPRSAGLIVAVLTALAIGGCAAHRQPAADATFDRLQADTLLAAGCYRCLEEAQTIYDRLAESSRRDAATARAHAFDAVVLLAVRDRELGLRAHDHAPAVRSRLASQTGGRAETFVAVMELVPWPVYSRDRR